MENVTHVLYDLTANDLTRRDYCDGEIVNREVVMERNDLAVGAFIGQALRSLEVGERVWVTAIGYSHMPAQIGYIKVGMGDNGDLYMRTEEAN